MKQKATLALFLVTIIWGWTFVWLKNALDASADYSNGDQTNFLSVVVSSNQLESIMSKVAGPPIL